MNQQEIHSIVTTQRRFFFSGKTQSVDTRIAALKIYNVLFKNMSRKSTPRSAAIWEKVPLRAICARSVLL